MAIYFKNTELAAQYNISEGTVRNWVKSAREGKLDLELSESKGRMYVANNISNIPVIEGLVRQNRKYRNTKAVKTITPNRALFEVFSDAQVYDIIRNLEMHNEIPRQYGYFREGVQEWEDYIERRLAVGAPSMLTRTIELLSDNYSYLDARLSRFDRINVVDIGVGNAAPVRGLLGHLLEQGKLGRYVALDFSDDMLDLAEEHIQEWFNDRIEFERHQLDIAHQRFSNIFEKDYLHPEANSVNLILFLGSTPNNLRVRDDAFRTIHESMNPNDLFVYTCKLAPTASLPEWFEHEVKHKDLGRPEVTRQHRLVFDLLGIKESFYDFEISYDENQKQRYARARLRVALSIVFNLEAGKRVLTFEKGDAIILWRIWRTTQTGLMDLLDDNGFYVLHSSQSEDHNYILTIAEPHHD